MRGLTGIAALAGAAILALAPGIATARITRIEIARTEPAFAGRTFGAAGAYERLIGKAYGEVDPAADSNALIQDIALAPRNARGMVEYVSDIEILRPAERAKGNGVLLFEIVNRGNKLALYLFNATVPGNLLAGKDGAPAAGDGFLQRSGYTLVSFGWQADVEAGGGRLTMTVPVARNADGSSVTGILRNELVAARDSAASTPTLNLSSGWFTGSTTKAYPTVSTDNRKPLADGFLPILTMRGREREPRVTIPNSEWSFGACPEGGMVAVNDTQICYPAGFRPGRLYELTYRAKDPLVLGLGFAVARDLGAFLKSAKQDDAGTANPVYEVKAKAIVVGSSQSGRYIRTLIHLGFNRDEEGRIVFDGALPHIGGGLLPLNLRFGQPGRAAGAAEFDHGYPGTDFPFAYASATDPLTGKRQGLLDRCQSTGTCPKIIHAATALEMWELHQSLGFTDPLGLRDLEDPQNVRSYIMTSTQHAPARLPLAPPAICQQQSNPNPQVWTMRALLQDLAAWVKDGTEPPASARPTIAAATLVAADQVNFPAIPANHYGGIARPAVRYPAAANPLHLRDYGSDYRPGDTSGVISADPPRTSPAQYGGLVPQVDGDGNDLGGIRSLFLAVPIGTYTGWNLFSRGYFEDDLCTLQGSFIPFAPTKAERLAAGDPRPSIEERYPTKAAYVAAIRKAADALVRERFLLAEDAKELVSQAEHDGIRSEP